MSARFYLAVGLANKETDLASSQFHVIAEHAKLELVTLAVSPKSDNIDSVIASECLVPSMPF